MQVDQEEGDAEGSGRYGTIPPFPPPPPGLDGTGNIITHLDSVFSYLRIHFLMY